MTWMSRITLHNQDTHDLTRWDYLACGIHNFVREHGGKEFAPYVCLSDIALRDAME